MASSFRRGGGKHREWAIGQLLGDVCKNARFGVQGQAGRKPAAVARGSNPLSDNSEARGVNPSPEAVGAGINAAAGRPLSGRA